MGMLEDLIAMREADLRLAEAWMDLVNALSDHAEALEKDGVRLEVKPWKGKLALDLRLVGPPKALPVPAPAPEPGPVPDGDPVPAPAPEPGPSAAPKTGDWTEDEDRELLALDAQGHPVKAVIAPRLGRSWQAVGLRLKKLKEERAEAPAPDTDPVPEPTPEPEPAPAPAPCSVATGRYALNLDALPTAREKAAERRLRAIGYPSPFTPSSDLKLVEALGAGSSMDAAARSTGLSPAQARGRWKALLPEVTLENQTALLKILKLRVELAEE
ncbi:hypothetical protein SAMN05216376_111145 [Mameliella alba]|nr:hypothetical protein [Mameliella alba]OWV46470.1 hypothetical protein CDZ96_17815 [Mameliella alba]PTR37279.1 hypothetical protein LX94_03618 [Mameliella alba]GGF73513.1 hypothetical protein GCM10011319_37500 [Mameliella alba]SDD77085.1 hypothetical protein SAMN05216376_111145 [Mameliella alba]